MKTKSKYAKLSFATAIAVVAMSFGSIGLAQTPPVVCSPATQNVTLGQTASVTATGGTGTYVWSAPGLSIINPNGSGFSASYASVGLKTLTVTSGGVSSTCTVNVLAGSTVPPPPVVTPGLPDTGGGYGK